MQLAMAALLAVKAGSCCSACMRTRQCLVALMRFSVKPVRCKHCLGIDQVPTCRCVHARRHSKRDGQFDIRTANLCIAAAASCCLTHKLSNCLPRTVTCGMFQPCHIENTTQCIAHQLNKDIPNRPPPFFSAVLSAGVSPINPASPRSPEGELDPPTSTSEGGLGASTCGMSMGGMPLGGGAVLFCSMIPSPSIMACKHDTFR
jgi:hypothetical protein